MKSLEIRRAEPGHFEGVRGLFERSDIPCFCQYFQFQGDNRAWQDQCANRSSENASKLCEDLQDRQTKALVALVEGVVVGWCRYSPVAQVSKLYEGRLYRGLPCFSGDREKVFAISCFLVEPAWRRKSVARRLLMAAVDACEEAGASAVEALPCSATDVSDEQQWLGPLSLYRESGFEMVHDFAPYPVMRRYFLLEGPERKKVEK